MGQPFAGKGDRFGKQVTLDDAVDDAELQGFVGFQGITGHAHFDGFGDARKPGKTLRAGRAGDEAKLYLWLTDLR